MKEKPYRTLAGRGHHSVGTWSRLYRGADHLLRVEASGVTENYRRFYYSDIRAIVVRKTKSAFVTSIVLAVLTGLNVLGVVLSLPQPDPAGAVIFAIIASVFGLFLLANLVKSPSCRTTLHTAVSEEELPSLRRVRAARKAIAAIAEAVGQAQGILPSTEFITEQGYLRDASRERPTAFPPAIPLSAGGYRGLLHRLLFGILLIDGLLTGCDIVYDNIPLTIASMITGMAVAVFAIVALVRGYQAGVGRGLHIVGWASLAYVVLALIAGYVLVIYLVMQNPAAMRNQWEQIAAFSALSASKHPPLFVMLAFFSACALSLGTAGFILLPKSLKSRSFPEPRDEPEGA